MLFFILNVHLNSTTSLINYKERKMRERIKQKNSSIKSKLHAFRKINIITIILTFIQTNIEGFESTHTLKHKHKQKPAHNNSN
jgi:hypothetical protein